MLGQFSQMHNHRGLMILFSAQRDFHSVVMPMPVRIGAFSEQKFVFLLTELWIEKPMAGTECFFS